jgi:hypothetical protein
MEQKACWGTKTRGNLSRIERDLKAFELHLAGCTVRGVCDELSLKSTQTAHNAIQRGRQYAIDHGIDVEERRIEIDRLFKSTLGSLASTLQKQMTEGQVEEIHTPDGLITKRKHGVCPRIAGELSRSLNRWAEFNGLLERAPEVNQANTVIQLSAPTDGASFASRWGDGGEQPVVDVTTAPEQLKAG